MTLLEKICAAFEKTKIPYAIVGGYAVALHGAVRGTIDIDFITKHTKKNFVLIEQTLKDLGFKSKLPVSASEVYGFKEEYIKNRNMIAWSFYHQKNQGEIIDIIITHDLKNYKKSKKTINKQIIYVLSIKDLISMKKDANRPQDIEDIKALQYIDSKGR